MRGAQLPVTLVRSHWLKKLNFVLPHSPVIIGADITTREELTETFSVLNKKYRPRPCIPVSLLDPSDKQPQQRPASLWVGHGSRARARHQGLHLFLHLSNGLIIS